MASHISQKTSEIWGTPSLVPGKSSNHLDAKGCLAKQIAHYFGRAGQSGVERGGVFTASLCHVWPAAAGAAYFLRQGSDDFPGGEAAGEIARYSGDEGDLSVFLR